jgi:Tol biopolymer transport system component
MRHLSATMAAKRTLWMCVALAAAILAAFLVVVLGTPTKPAEAAFPGNNGKIAFVSNLGPSVSDSEIVTMNANGDNKTQLTNNRANESGPAFSPNGRKIAFESNRRTRQGNIFTMSDNGTDIKPVTTSSIRGGDSTPAWSPDGTKIAFNRKGDIYVINKNGTGLTRLTTSQQDDINPAWSPDGTKIAFARGPFPSTRIYVMKAAPESVTNIPQRLTTSAVGAETDLSWSPDGTRIAFVSTRNGNTDIYVINQAGIGLTRLTTYPKPDTQPAWSPDGTKIAFTGAEGGGRILGICVMKAKPVSESNRPKRLTGTGNPSLEPDWQPLP